MHCTKLEENYGYPDALELINGLNVTSDGLALANQNEIFYSNKKDWERLRTERENLRQQVAKRVYRLPVCFQMQFYMHRMKEALPETGVSFWW